jgi:hypothetical protein
MRILIGALGAILTLFSPRCAIHSRGVSPGRGPSGAAIGLRAGEDDSGPCEKPSVIRAGSCGSC